MTASYGSLAKRLDVFAGRARSTIDSTTLSVDGQAIALGMLVTVYLPAIEETVIALRAAMPPVAAERERCARIAEGLYTDARQTASERGRTIAAAIRDGGTFA